MKAMPTAASGFLRIEFAQLILGLGELLAVGEELAPLAVERRGGVGGLRPQLVEVGPGDELLGAVHRVLGVLGGGGQRSGRRRPACIVVLVRHVPLRRFRSLMRSRAADDTMAPVDYRLSHAEICPTSRLRQGRPASDRSTRATQLARSAPVGPLIGPRLAHSLGRRRAEAAAM